MAKQNQNQKKKQKTKNNKPQLSATTPPLGCAIVFFCFVLFFCFLGFLFFLFFRFLVSCFLVRCWFFEGLAKQHKSEGPRPNSLPVLASSPTLGVANLLLVDFIVCFGPKVLAQVAQFRLR
jgi:ABC-type Fe3+ transport system permease subunit